MKSKQVIFWDFDGVMSNSTNFVFSYWKKSLNQAGYIFEIEDYQKTFMAKFPFDYLTENFPDVAEHIYQEYSTYEDTYYSENVPPYDGFIEAFAQLNPGYCHFIVSANLQSVIEPWLCKHGMNTYFSQVLGRETKGHKDEKIQKIITANSLSPDACIFVGDTISDMNHAQVAGIENIAATWGVHTKEQLKTTNPNYTCDSIEELFKLLSDE